MLLLFLLLLAAPALAGQAGGLPPEDLFLNAADCRGLDAAALDNAESMERFADCMLGVSPDLGVYPDIPVEAGRQITLWAISSAEPTPYQAQELAKLQADLSYTLARHLKGGVYAGRAIVLKTTILSALLGPIAECPGFDSRNGFENELPKIERCLKAESAFKISRVSLENGRLRVESAADAKTRASLSGTIGVVDDRARLPRLVFVDVVCTGSCS